MPVPLASHSSSGHRWEAACLARTQQTWKFIRLNTRHFALVAVHAEVTLGWLRLGSVRTAAGNRQEDPAAEDSGKVDIVAGDTVGDTAAGDTAAGGIAETEIVTMDIAAEKSIACTEVVRMN